MFIPLWLLGLIALALVVLAWLAFYRRDGGEMLEGQRRAAPRHMARVHPILDEAGILARPEIATHLAAGRKIEAIKAVREASGLGLREAKELVERGM
jgi:hypothetical protein